MTSFDDPLQNVQEKVKRYLPQWQRFTDATKELIARGTCLLSGNSEEEDYKQYLRLVSHVESIWDASAALYRTGKYPLSVYLAIAALEETGKVGVARFQIVLRDIARQSGQPVDVARTAGRRGNPFYSHSDKHLLAAGAGAIVNSRLDRVLGFEPVCDFLDAVAAGKVEAIRQSALYADVSERGAILPSDVIDDRAAQFYVILAGELLADILGADPKQWERLLRKVQQFEKDIGHVWE
jgi:AbiV family abortive infection protein